MNRSRLWIRATCLLLCAACHGDATTSTTPVVTGPVATSVVIVSGNNQTADPEDALPDTVRFKVLDGEGRIMPGTVLSLSVPIGGGQVPAPAITTDSTGIARTTWTMGASGGVQQLEARVNGALMATVTATTCDPSECFPTAQLSGTLSNATLVSLSTYDSSGQAVHPDIVRGHGSATGFWMAITPYPGGNAAFENPSIFHSADATTWKVPTGATNPVVRGEAPAYLSDPDLVVNTDQSVWMYYRSVENSQNIIKVTRSLDGVHWDSSRSVVVVPSHQLVSPSVVRGAPQGKWQMWSVNAGPQGCSAPFTTIERRTSSDGLKWNAPNAINIDQPGQTIWHIDVQWIAARNEYWALYNTYPSGTSCSTNALFIARSPDGVNWTTYPSPIARLGVVSAFKHLLYRSTFMTNPKATSVKLWLSGAEMVNNAYSWKTATVTTSVDGLFALASAPATLLRTAPYFGKLPPPEPDEGPDR
ncbi:MAG: hypothetical protein ABUL71_01805 [Gemmatimonadota bacterium]